MSLDTIMRNPPRAAYIHIPFCRRRCGYCNFTVVAGRPELQNDFLRALGKELERLETPQPVDTLYLGGGTPTELGIEYLDQLCQLVRHWFPPSAGCEWSIEANPYRLSRDKLLMLAEYGVNRVSLGVQSFDSRKLELLEREHRYDDILSCYERCRGIFRSISLDLIFGAPDETIQQWDNDLRLGMQLQPDHFSIYGLTYEKGTNFWSRRRHGALHEVDEELQRSMYQLAIDELVAQGWYHYEISNFARPAHRCRHNELYWSGGSYFAAGPGAARHLNGRRETNHRSTTTYMRRVLAGESPVAESETLSSEERAREQLIFQLRMLEGVRYEEFASATGFRIDDLAGDTIRNFLQLGFLEVVDDRIRLTREGLMISDSLWPDLL